MIADVLGVILGLSLIAGLAWDLYCLGKRNGYHAGQCDAAVDYRRELETQERWR